MRWEPPWSVSPVGTSSRTTLHGRWLPSRWLPWTVDVATGPTRWRGADAAPGGKAPGFRRHSAVAADGVGVTVATFDSAPRPRDVAAEPPSTSRRKAGGDAVTSGYELQVSEVDSAVRLASCGVIFHIALT